MAPACAMRDGVAAGRTLPFSDHRGEPGEAVEAMGINAVAGGLGEEPGGEGGLRFGKAEGDGGLV